MAKRSRCQAAILLLGSRLRDSRVGVALAVEVMLGLLSAGERGQCLLTELPFDEAPEQA
jgi:hypothetical protein